MARRKIRFDRDDETDDCAEILCAPYADLFAFALDRCGWKIVHQADDRKWRMKSPRGVAVPTWAEDERPTAKILPLRPITK